MNKKFPLDPLVEAMITLRGKDGCPWDREQTHQSLRKYLVEETYEVIDAINSGEMHKLCEELGDLLLQIAFHAQIASETGQFDINDVVQGITQKLIRRHPHVFSDVSLRTAEEVTAQWEKIKSREVGQAQLLSDIPKSMPALIRAQKTQEKVAKIGFDWPNLDGAWEKLREEISELRTAITMDKGQKEELGDVLFATVNVARFLKIDAEEALRDTVDKFYQRFSYIEEQAKLKNSSLEEMSLVEMDELWEEAKRHEIENLNKKTPII